MSSPKYIVTVLPPYGKITPDSIVKLEVRDVETGQAANGTGQGWMNALEDARVKLKKFEPAPDETANW